MTTWLFLYACLGLGWGVHNAGPSYSAGSHALTGTGDSDHSWDGTFSSFLFPYFSMYSCPLSFSSSLLSLLPLTHCASEHSTLLSLPLRTAFIIMGQAQPPGRSLLASPRCRWLERVKTRSSSCLLVRSERGDASRKSLTCQLSVRRQPSPPRCCPCHRGGWPDCKNEIDVGGMPEIHFLPRMLSSHSFLCVYRPTGFLRAAMI